MLQTNSLKTTYRWSTLQGDIASLTNCLESTPVLWIKEPGVYRCQVENDLEVCYSANIVVKAEGTYMPIQSCMLYKKVICIHFISTADDDVRIVDKNNAGSDSS